MINWLVDLWLDWKYRNEPTPPRLGTAREERRLEDTYKLGECTATAMSEMDLKARKMLLEAEAVLKQNMAKKRSEEVWLNVGGWEKDE